MLFLSFEDRRLVTPTRIDGSLIRNKTVGPYFVSYIVKKVGGRWLVERSSTARANPLPPVVDGISPASRVAANEQFFVNITGQSFDPRTVYLKVVGPGCPADSPCTVPNSALRQHSQLSGTMLANVPLTLAAGEYTIAIQNGESKPSDSVRLSVP
ncbi:MAG: hypothetical protein ACK4S4_07700 [Pyrinomonadaceae bacterium]